jgi:hypothetical protein
MGDDGLGGRSCLRSPDAQLSFGGLRAIFLKRVIRSNAKPVGGRSRRRARRKAGGSNRPFTSAIVLILLFLMGCFVWRILQAYV